METLSVDTFYEDDKMWYVKKQFSNETGIFSSSRVHILRLGPSEDLLDCLFKYARVTGIKAASIVSAVGSLQQTNVRYANADSGVSLTGFFEIVNLVGNIDSQSMDPTDKGSGHVHIAISDGNGVTIGGHLLTGNLIYTTAEITLVEIINGLFERVLDYRGSGYKELQVKRDGALVDKDA